LILPGVAGKDNLPNVVRRMKSNSKTIEKGGVQRVIDKLLIKSFNEESGAYHRTRRALSGSSEVEHRFLEPSTKVQFLSRQSAWTTALNGRQME
jgi:hypothetical protein